MANKWKRIRDSWYWVGLFALALVAILYSFYRKDAQSYWDGAIGNWLATLLGIISGVPLALSIERKRIFREERERTEQQAKRAKAGLINGTPNWYKADDILAFDIPRPPSE